MENYDNIYKDISFLFKTKEDIEKAFKNMIFEAQIKIIENSPKDGKVYLFSLLSDKNRTRKTLNSLKDIDMKSAEKYLFVDNNTNLGLSKADFKNRLKFFNSHK